MSLTKASARIVLFALLLGVLVLSLFGSLIAADRALASADRESVELDAHGAALVAERELRLKAETLAELFGPLLPSTVTTLSRSDTAIPSEAFDAVWVLNTKGGIVWSRSRSASTVDSAILASLAGETTTASWPRVRAIASGADSVRGAVLLGVPLSHRGQLLGAAVGLVSGERILAMLQDGAMVRPKLAIRHAGRPIAMAGSADRTASASHLSAIAPVRLPGDALEVEVFHARSGRALRTALWMLGVIAFVALLAVLARERRQALNLAERTTELERLYQEVARSNRMKSEFLANVSHELRTPLNAIVGFVEMLREGVYGELTPRQALPADRIAASATHLRHLVDRLLDIAKIAAGRLEIHAEPLVLRPFVLNVASEMESLVSERGLALTIGVGPSLPRIRTDQTHLRQILINLIGNAVKYTPSGGIQVRARLAGNGATPLRDAPAETEPLVGTPPDPARLWVALQVADTGVGIAAADLERIFDEFEQVNAGARSDSARRGTGLGLAISRRLARLLGGDLTVVSEPGRGSVFTVWLPLDSPEKKAD
jgi:signal transduction histidine kinase